MPANVTLATSDVSVPTWGEFSALVTRVEAIEKRLDGTPQPPDPPPPPPPDPPPSGELDLGDFVVEPGQMFPPPVATIRLRSLWCKEGSTFKPSGPLTIITKNEPGAGAIRFDGVMDSRGAVKTPFVRLAGEPKSGDTTLTLSQPVVNWQPGDRLLIPDSRAKRPDNHIERPTIASIAGNVVTLQSPLAFDHPGGIDGSGNLEFLPVVANTTRGVVIKSESASGVRGYVTFGATAKGTVRGVSFNGLGQTRIDPIDASNPKDRPAVRFDKTTGMEFSNNVIMCPLDPMPFRWGLMLDGASGNNIAGNVIYNWAGAGLMTCEGTEANTIDSNFICRITAAPGVDRPDDRGGDMGVEGSAFWFRGPLNRVTNNIAANCSRFGYQYYCRFADDSIVNRTPIAQFDNNEAFGVHSGLSYWWIGCQNRTVTGTERSTLSNFRAWAVAVRGVYAYESHGITFDDLTLRSDIGTDALCYGVLCGDYFSHDTIIRNADIRGFRIGIQPSTDTGGSAFTIEDSYLSNYCSVDCQMLWTSGHVADFLQPRKIVLRNVRYGDFPRPVYPPPEPQCWIDRRLHSDGDTMNYVQLDQIEVYDHNGKPGDNFKVYYAEQTAGSILRETAYWPDGAPRIIACPEAGLRNDQALERHKVCLAGEIAPDNARADSKIQGLVA